MKDIGAAILHLTNAQQAVKAGDRKKAMHHAGHAFQQLNADATGTEDDLPSATHLPGIPNVPKLANAGPPKSASPRRSF